MKKLMIAAAVIAMGFAAQANAIKWGVMNVTPSGTDPATTGYAAYLFVAGDTSGAFKTYTLASVTGELDKGNLAVLDNAIASATAGSVTTSGNASWTTQTATPTEETGNTLTAFLIIIDDDQSHYLVSKASGEALMAKTVASGTNAYQFLYGSQAANTSWQTIPEPTSGLLLLLGVAGLALKRRRA